MSKAVNHRNHRGERGREWGGKLFASLFRVIFN